MADTKISALTAAAAAAAANELAINEAGTSKKVTMAQVATYVKPTAYAYNTFTIATENGLVLAKRLSLTTTQRATLAGTARLRIT